MSVEGDSAHPYKPLQAQRQHFHPPAANTPSRDVFTLQRGFWNRRFRRPGTAEGARARGWSGKRVKEGGEGDEKGGRGQ